MYKKIISVMSVALVVFLCSFSVFANDNANGYQQRNINTLTQDGKLRYQINTSVLHLNRETALQSGTGSYTSYNTECLMTIIFTNQSSTEDIYCDNLWGFTVFVDSKLTYGTVAGETQYSPYKITDVQPLSDNNFVVCNLVGTTDSPYTFNFFPDPQFAYNSRVCVPAGTSLVAQFTYKVSGYYAPNQTGDTGQFQIPTTVVTNLNTSTWTSGSFPIKAPYYSLYSINLKMDELLEAYNGNSQSSQNVIDNSTGASSTIGDQHEQEASYFEDSQSAIEDTGIQNFQFNSQELGGLNGLKDDFTSVWTACGSLSRYWISSLTIGLALAIIRHRRMFDK